MCASASASAGSRDALRSISAWATLPHARADSDSTTQPLASTDSAARRGSHLLRALGLPLPATSASSVCVAQSLLSECRGYTVEGLSTEVVAYPTSGYARRIFAFDFFAIAPSSTQSWKEKLAACASWWG